MPSSRVRATKARKSVHRAELRVDGVVPALGAADRPRGADLVGPDVGGVAAGELRRVRTLAVHPADRVDRRQVDDVEAHARRSPAGGPARWRTCRAWPCRRRPDPPTAGRTRTRSRTGAVARSTQTSWSGVAVTSSRTGCSCRYRCRDAVKAGAMRAVSSSDGVAQRGGRGGEGVPVLVVGVLGATRSSSRAPSSRSLARSSAPWPASTFTSTAWCHVASGSLHASTRKVQRPSRSGTTVASQRSGSGAELRHPDQRGSARPVRGRPHDVRRDGVMALAEHGGGDRQVLADHGAGARRPAGHDRGDIGDAEAEVSAASHPRNAIEPVPHQHLGFHQGAPPHPLGRPVTVVPVSTGDSCHALAVRRTLVSLVRCELFVGSPSVRRCPNP